MRKYYRCFEMEIYHKRAVETLFIFFPHLNVTGPAVCSHVTSYLRDNIVMRYVWSEEQAAPTPFNGNALKTHRKAFLFFEIFILF